MMNAYNMANKFLNGLRSLFQILLSVSIHSTKVKVFFLPNNEPIMLNHTHVGSLDVCRSMQTSRCVCQLDLSRRGGLYGEVISKT